MPAKIVETVDALVTSLDGGTFTQAFTAEKRQFPLFDVRDVDALTVVCYSLGRQIEKASRQYAAASWPKTWQVACNVKQRTDGSNDEVDDLLLLVEQIADHVADAGKLAGAVVREVTTERLYDARSLDQQALFDAEIIITLAGFE